MAYTVKVGGVDITSGVLARSFSLVNSGAQDVAVLSFTYRGSTAIDPEDPVEVLDGLDTIFYGKVRNRVRTSIGSGTSRTKAVKVTAQDATAFLTDDVIDAGGERSTTEGDDDRVVWLITTFQTTGITADLVAGGGFVQEVYGPTMPATQDFTGMNLYQALEEVCRVSGAQFYIDADRKLHYFATESNAAPWNFSDTPNGTTTKGFFDAEYPDDTIELANAVWVQGNGVSGWRTDDPSITAYGRREASLIDQNITTTTERDAAGDAFLAQYAWPRSPVRLKTRHSGLQAGMTIQLTDSLWSISAASYPITEVVTTVADANQLLYDVTLGSRPITLATQNSDFSRWVNVVESTAQEAASANAPDVTAPSAPSSITASSDVETVNGEAVVRLTVTLTQPGDSDLYGSWVEVERAVGDASPTWANALRGFIPAGDDSVTFEGVAGATPYYIRAYAEDVSGNASSPANASVYPYTTAADATPPAIPVIEDTVAAVNAIGVRWTSSSSSDLRTYQIRWSSDAGVTYSDPVGVRATVYTIVGLDNTKTYRIQVRAIDASGNVDDGTGVAVNYLSNPEAGWSDYATETPAQVTGSDIAAGTILANNLAAGSITTEKLSGNTITVRDTGSYARGFVVEDGSGNELGRWDTDGIIIRDPTDPANRFIVLDSGEIRLVTDGDAANAPTAITPDGIDAAKVNFGTAVGGHNLVRNSSFELSSNTGADSSASHTDTTAWTAGNRTSTDNVTEGTSLTVTAW